MTFARDARERVIARDGGVCVDCGNYAHHVHHIVHRGQAADHLIWDERNMLSLCAVCHERANGAAAKCRHLRLLAERYHYTYEEQPWIGLLRFLN